MTRYADPHRCPDCRSAIHEHVDSCPACALPLQHPLAAELLSTLGRADLLLDRLRQLRLEPVGAPAPVAAPAPAPAFPVLPPAPEVRRGLRGASVPVVLLGLGALCLVVAAITFLAVAWSHLGIGGRTAVLVALTALAATTALWAGRRGLRVAAESLSLVALALLALDCLGAADAGWFGSLHAGGTALVTGAVVAGGGLALGLGRSRLVGPQVVAALGAWVVVAAALDLTGDLRTTALAGAAGLLGLAVGARRAEAPVLAWSALVACGTWALVALSDAYLAALADPTTEALWLDGPAPTVLSCAAAGLLACALARVGTATWLLVVTLATTGLTTVLLLPAIDEGTAVVTLATSAAVAAWAVTGRLVQPGWVLAARVPQLLAALPVAGVLVLLLVEAAARVLLVGPPAGSGVDVRLGAPGTHPEPTLLLLASGVLLAAAWLSGTLRRTPLLVLSTVTASLAGAATLALHPVPLVLVVAALALPGLGLVVATVVRGVPVLAGSVVAAATGTLLAGLAVVAALPSAGLTAAAAALLALGAGLLVAGRAPAAVELGHVALPAALALAAWSAADVAGLAPGARGLPVLLVLGALALLLPRPSVEAVAATAATVAGSLAVLAAVDQPLVLAVQLTVAGALVTTTALVHAHRRGAVWLGGLLLAAATWVRLLDLDVDVVEAYTLPTAAVLLALGLVRLLREPAADTGRTLRPGLALALVPSLLRVLLDGPATPRAAALGTVCLGLVLLGARLRWNAPLVLGAAVGAAVVLHELAPYAGQTPRWVLIGSAGTLLTVAGITWERRLQDLGRATDYLARLR